MSTAVEIADDVRAGRRSASEVLEESLAAIEAREPELHAFNLVTADAARESAADVDRRVAAGQDPGPLAGVPVALKDNLCTRGVPTTCSSKMQSTGHGSRHLPHPEQSSGMMITSMSWLKIAPNCGGQCRMQVSQLMQIDMSIRSGGDCHFGLRCRVAMRTARASLDMDLPPCFVRGSRDSRT